MERKQKAVAIEKLYESKKEIRIRKKIVPIW